MTPDEEMRLELEAVELEERCMHAILTADSPGMLQAFSVVVRERTYPALHAARCALIEHRADDALDAYHRALEPLRALASDIGSIATWSRATPEAK